MRPIAESLEKEAHDFELQRQRDEEELLIRQNKDRELMAKMQRLRRETLESSHQKEIGDMQAAHKRLRDALDTALQSEIAQFHDTWNQKRAELTARHATERSQLESGK